MAPTVLAPLFLGLPLAAPTAATPPNETRAPGDADAPVTWAEHVAPVVYRSCTPCHRPGEAAPFPLLGFRDAQKRGRMIQMVTQTRYMPPWHPMPGYGEFADARALEEDEIRTIARWVEDGMPSGDLESAPEPPEFTEGWQLGEPDLVVTMDQAYEVPADGPDIYRNFVLPLDLEEDRWVTAVEARPSARSVVHHYLFFLDDTGSARQREAREEGLGFDGIAFQNTGSLGGWAVGGNVRHLPLDLAMPLTRGSDLVLQAHFHPSGKAEREQTTVGIYFADEPPKRTLIDFQVPPDYGSRAGLDVPAGEPFFALRDEFVVPVDVQLVSIGGHAHLICEKMIGKARFPDGRMEPLIFIDDWDFNWQGIYQYKEPMTLPAGTTIEVELIYNNSESNPQNPNHPPKRISWGLESTDEMGSLIFDAVPLNEEDLGVFELISTGREYSGYGSNGALLLLERAKGLDQDGDGFVDKDEVPARFRRVAEAMDLDGDKRVSRDELAFTEARLHSLPPAFLGE